MVDPVGFEPTKKNLPLAGRALSQLSYGPICINAKPVKSCLPRDSSGLENATLIFDGFKSYTPTTCWRNRHCCTLCAL